MSAGFTNSISGPLRDFAQGNPIARIVSAAVAGGTASVLGGGKFENGAKTAAFLGMFMAAADYFQRTAGGNATLRPGELHPGQPEAVLDANGRQVPSDQARDVIGLSRQFDGSWKDFITQSGPLSAALNLIPGFNGGFARLHDWLFTSGTLPFNLVTNFGSMPYAMGVGYMAIVGQPLQALSTQQLINLSVANSFDRDDKRRAVSYGAAIGGP